MKGNVITRHMKGQQGFALILAVVAILLCTSVVLLAGLSLTRSISLSPGLGQEQRTLAAAEAGIDAAIARIEADLLADPDWRQANGAYDPAGALTGEVDGARFTVTFLNDVDDPEHDAYHVTLQSTAVYGENRCIIRKGLTRNAQGGNFAIFCNNNGGFDNTMMSQTLGNVYTNANINCGMPVVRKVQGRVYHQNGVGLVNVDPLEGDWIVDARYHLNNGWIQAYQNQWQAAQNLLAVAPPNPPNTGWGAGVHNYAGNNFFSTLTFAGPPGDRIIATPAVGPLDPPANLIFTNQNLTTLGGVTSIRIAAGSRVNLIFAGPVRFVNNAVLIDDSDEPTGLFFMHDRGLWMGNNGRIYPNHLQIYTHRFFQDQWGNWYRTQGNRGELTFYIHGPFVDPTPGNWGGAEPDETGIFNFYYGNPPKTNQILANIILDFGARLYADRSDNIWGRVYCFNDSQLIFNTMGDVPGTQATAANVVSENPATACTFLRNSATIRETAARIQNQDLSWVRNWTQPPTGAPVMLGLNPAGTGGYSSWTEVR